ncbi:hypothetical protein FEE96_15315 [Parasedimentitalea maritima]|uniref:Blue (type 1) copper domain-containing protein n=1 Tax=Parasedimentitalea maritima TaxID=2578117 RepID=A0A5R8Z768_9RHOB|nr:plastocyanin/azurin family copper-binding protein [Zongyanglinia marina]KAE9628808.1 hypothetical protein GP644_13655 [Zongyanglinia marina]TLP61603.1 hypothetical protein FEE96_15315 [Zongyanglinia marina]
MKRISSYLFLMAFAAAPVLAENITVDLSQGMKHDVNQVTDPMATAATGMFRFDPPLVQLEPGEALVFLNSRGQHTVHSVPQLWPADRDPVAISNKPRVEVQFDEPGVYGLRCNRHGQYGMAMLVVVGDGGGVTSIDAEVEEMRAHKKEKQAFLDLFAAHLAGN